MRKAILTLAAAIAVAAASAAPSMAAGSAVDRTVPDPDAKECSAYRLKPFRMLALCAIGRKQRAMDDPAVRGSPMIYQQLAHEVRSRWDFIEAIDDGLLPTRKQQQAMFGAMLDDEAHQHDIIDQTLQQMQAATMTPTVPVTMPDFSAPQRVAAPAPAPSSFTCARLIGLPGYTRCTTD